MKTSLSNPVGRNSEHGAIAIVIAAMWMTLFGMAVLAVDFGYLFSRQRNLQSVADAAVTAAMPTFQSSSLSAAQTRAYAIADANGYSNNATTTVAATSPAAGQFQVTIRRTFPTFFASVFGMSSKQVTGTATGKVTAGPTGSVIHADNTVCGGFGFTATGGAILNVAGDVESNGILNLNLAGAITGTAKVRDACALQPQVSGGYIMPAVSSLTGTATYTDPLAAMGITPASFAGLCKLGTSLINPADPMSGATWSCGTGPGGSDVLESGVYCSLNNLAVTTPCPNQKIYAPDSTFVSATGAITFTANNGVTLGYFPGAPGNIVAITGSSAGGPVIFMGSADPYTVTGTFYAPNGQLMNTGGGALPNTFNGRMVAKEIFFGLSAGSVWNFAGGGGPSLSSWSLYR
jgi:Flp pilus assembly protein TadG